MERLGLSLAISMRYDRNIRIEGFGEEGQRKLRAAGVLVVGAGGLGSPVLLYLAAAGIGRLGIIDDDKVAISNLQRQIIHFTPDVERSKVVSAKEKIAALNPEVSVITHTERLDAQNAAALIGGYDFVIDCCDNYATKFLLNDVCVQAGKAYSHGAVLGMRGEAMTVIPGSACYRCVFDKEPGDSAQSTLDTGVLGSVAGIIGSIQATEAIKYITGTGELLTDRILIADARSMQFYTLKVKKTCRLCR